MGEKKKNNIVQFEIGCYKCSHLVQVGRRDFVCSERVHMDDSQVMPIVNGEKTDDWNICGGEHREYVSVLLNKGRSKSG